MVLETLEDTRNPWFVLLAIISAFLGSFTSSRIINRRSGSRGVLNTVLLIVSAISVAWGASAAMLTWSLAAITIHSPSNAFSGDIEVEVNQRDYLIALMLGLGLSTFALGLAGDPNHPSKRRFYIGGAINGIGILFMQSFAITEGISIEPVVVVVNRPSLVPVSLLFMVTCSALAWRIFFRSQALWEATVWNYRVHLISGSLFSFGLLTMHFIGLSSFDFEVDVPVVFPDGHGKRIGRSVLITIATLFLCFTAAALVVSEVRTYYYIQAVERRRGHMLLSVMFAYTEPEGEANFPAAKHKMVNDALARSRSQPDLSVSPFSAGKCHDPNTQLILCDRIGFLPGVLVDEEYKGTDLFNKDNSDFSRMLRASFNWEDTDFPEGKSDTDAHKKYSDRLFSKFLHAVLYLAHKLHVDPNDMGRLYYKPINLDEGVMLLLVSRIHVLQTATALTSVGRFKWGLQPLVEPMIYRMYNDADLYGEKEQSWLDDAIEYEHACTRALPQTEPLVTNESTVHSKTGFPVPAPSVRVMDSPDISRAVSLSVRSEPIPASTVVSIDPKAEPLPPPPRHLTPSPGPGRRHREPEVSVMQAPDIFDDAIQASQMPLARRVQKQFDAAVDPEAGGVYVSFCVLRISVGGLAVAVDPASALHMFPSARVPGHSGLLRPEEREFLHLLCLRSPHLNIAEATVDELLAAALPTESEYPQHRSFAASFLSATRELAAKIGNSDDLTVRNLCNLGVLRLAAPADASPWIPYDAVDMPVPGSACMHPPVSRGELECSKCGGYEKVGSIRPVRVILFGLTTFSRLDHLEGYNKRLTFIPLPTFESAHFAYHRHRSELAHLREEIMKESDSLMQAPPRARTGTPSAGKLARSCSLKVIKEGTSPVGLMQAMRSKSSISIVAKERKPDPSSLLKHTQNTTQPPPGDVPHIEHSSHNGNASLPEHQHQRTGASLSLSLRLDLARPSAGLPGTPSRVKTNLDGAGLAVTPDAPKTNWLGQLMESLSEQNKERNEERRRARRQSLPTQPASSLTPEPQPKPRRQTTLRNPGRRQDDYKITISAADNEVKGEESVLSNTESTGSATRRPVIDMGTFGDEFETCELPAGHDERDSPSYRAANTTVPNLPPPSDVEMVDTVHARDSSDLVHRMRDGAVVRVSRRPRFAREHPPRLEMFQMLDEHEDKVGVFINRKGNKSRPARRNNGKGKNKGANRNQKDKSEARNESRRRSRAKFARARREAPPPP